MDKSRRDGRRIAADHESLVRRFFTSKGLAAEEVEDLTQDIMLAVIEGIGRFGGRSSVSTWIYAICRNTYQTHSYRRERLNRITGVGSQDREPENREHDAVVVRSIIETMPVQLREVYHLYFEKGLTVRETAANLGRPEGTVKYLLSELRRRFRSEWM